MQDLKITLVQTDLVWENPEQNRRKFDLILDSPETDTDLVILPEMFPTGFTMNAAKVCEPEPGASLEWMKSLAGRLNAVVTGSILINEKGKYYNRLYWVEPDGKYLSYDKRHLFTMAGEDKVMTAGSRRLICELKGWKVMPNICYDLRFPVWNRNRYSPEKGYDYDLLFFVANWPERRRNAYLKLLAARAIENQSFVAWVNRVGSDHNGVEHTGDSCVFDPAGESVASLPAKKEDVLNVTLNRTLLERIRTRLFFAPDWDNFQVF
ncbi:MAG: nitrilase family protein [Bacteroidales bacterium]